MGRFTTQDSFLGEINDPPSLHRYFYAHANPTRFVDRSGHEVAVAGNKEDVERFKTEVLHDWAGSEADFNKTFRVDNGKVVANEDAQRPTDPAGAKLWDAVRAKERYLYYYGPDPKEAASHLGEKADVRKSVAKQFEGRGYDSGAGTVVSTRGRKKQYQPEDGVDTYVALNSDATQTQVAGGKQIEGTVVEGDVKAGTGKTVPPYRFFFHETVENQEFARQTPVASDYAPAHFEAVKSEVEVEKARNEGTGFAGGKIQTRVDEAKEKKVRKP